MKKLIPQNDMVLCKLVSSDEKTTESGFVYKSNDIPLYCIEEVGPQVKNFNVGDIVVVNSTGTMVEFNDNEYFLFKEENIMGKVENG